MTSVGCRTTSIEHPARWVAASLATFGASAAVALRDPVPEWEQRLTTAINGVPDVVAWMLWPVMQAGAAAAPIAIGVVALASGRRRLAASVVISGLGAWFVAKGIKHMVGRGRPLAYLPDLELREGDGSGLGFVSGHSAVAAACAVCIMGALPRRWRVLPVAVAGAVGVARIVYGMHFPADVVGGWSVGVALGVATTWLTGAVTTRRAGQSAATAVS